MFSTSWALLSASVQCCSPDKYPFFTNMASHYTITNHVIRYDVSWWSLHQILTMLLHFPFFIMPLSTVATTNLPFYVLFSCVFSTVHEIYTFCCTDHICSVNLLCVLSSVLVDTSCRLSSNHILHIAKYLCHVSVRGLTSLSFPHETVATVLCHSKVSTVCLMYHFMVAEFRLKVKAFTTLVTFKGFIQVSVHVFFKGPW